MKFTNGDKAVDPTHYREMVGTLMYLIAKYQPSGNLHQQSLGDERLNFYQQAGEIQSYAETLKQLADEAEE
ncbi:hypothetical protein Tco_0206159 [Tanacetum coccineum]